ncbi:MAG TPA: type II toxin-antitoxin system PemK/MazF family toxin [Candidatus Deferrimicrobiaceae bacterium]|nr:type II toxin-antitoxin system PemK/MazF family toxin [Candidatus Deferrimicrobiaceae bacterium]
MPRIQPGEIWKVKLSDTEGHEQIGDRPAIVIALHSQAIVAMVVPLTKNQDCLRFPYSYQVKMSNVNGLKVNSVALIYQMRCLTASSTRFVDRYGIIEQCHLDQIKLLIKSYLKIS